MRACVCVCVLYKLIIMISYVGLLAICFPGSILASIVRFTLGSDLTFTQAM